MRFSDSFKGISRVAIAFLFSWGVVLLVELHAGIREILVQILYGVCVVMAWAGMHWALRKSLRDRATAFKFVVTEATILGILLVLVFVGVIFIVNLKFLLGGSI